MKAVRIHAPGGPEALKYDDVPEPTPGQGQAAIKVGACGVNYIDVYFRTGQYKAQLPLTIGLEGAGNLHNVGGTVFHAVLFQKGRRRHVHHHVFAIRLDNQVH